MQKVKNKLLLRKDDYEILVSYIRGQRPASAFDRRNMEELQEELGKAKVFSKEKFPSDVVRLNSKVRIQEENKNEIMELTLVLPEKADIKQRHISIMAPIGTALLGFRQGEKVQWKVPSGSKTFNIIEVENAVS